MCIAEKIRLGQLQAYKGRPGLIRSDANSEKEDRKNYFGRPFFELLQNIEDAIGSLETSRRNPTMGCCVILQQGTLWVANHGAPFTDRGFDALCMRSDSPKYGKGFIGSKGTGFKAVLNWSLSPEIHSGGIQARFDAALSRQAIIETISEDTFRGLCEEEPSWDGDVPILRLPFPAEPDPVTQRLIGDGWSTVVKLPLRGNVEEEVRKALNEFNPASLVILRHISFIKIDAEDDVRLFNVGRKEKDGWKDVVVREQRTGAEVELRYMVCRESPDIQPKEPEHAGNAEIAIAFCDDDGHPEQGEALYNFFPIRRERGPFSGLMCHATFLLKPDRDHLLESDWDYHESLARALGELLTDRVVPRLAERFGPRMLIRIAPLAPVQESHAIGSEVSHSGHVRIMLVDRVRMARFVPDIDGTSRAPEEVRLWKWRLGILLSGCGVKAGGGYLANTDWQVEDQYREILKVLGGKELTPLEHVEALRGIEPSDRATALSMLRLVADALNAAERSKQSDMIAAARGLTIWRTTDGLTRALADAVPFFQSIPKNLPLRPWLEVSVLDPEFAKAWEQESENVSIKERLSDVWKEHLHEYSVPKFSEKALLPHLRRQNNDAWWELHGREVLRLLQELQIKALPDLSKVVRVPTRGGPWKPAFLVYAGEEWNSPLGELLGSRLPDRYVLAPPDQFDVAPSDALQEFLVALGVAWEPRLIESQSEDWCCSREQLAHCNPFDGRIPDEEWSEFMENEVIAALRNGDEQLVKLVKAVGRWRIREVTGFEGLAYLRENPKSHAELVSLLRTLRDRSGNGDTEIERAGPQGGTRSSFTGPSFAHWQLRHTPIFQSRGAPLSDEYSSPNRMILAVGGQPGWTAWLPRLDLSEFSDEVERRRLEAFAIEQLGVISKLESIPDERWWEWLRQLPTHLPFEQVEPDELIQTVKPIKGFLHDFIGHAQKPEHMGTDFFLPCRNSTGLSYRHTGKFLILDEARFEPLRAALMQEPYVLSVTELSDGKKLADVFDIETSLLSVALTLDISPEVEHYEKQDIADQINKHQSHILALITASSNEDKAKQLEKYWPTLIKFCNHLTVRPTLAGHELPSVPVGYHWEDEDRSLFIDERRLWDNLAGALCNRIELRSGSEDALARLLEKLGQQEELDQFLRHKGITAEAVERWKPEPILPPVTPPRPPIVIQPVTPPPRPPPPVKPPPVKPPPLTDLVDDGDVRPVEGKRAEDYIREWLVGELGREWSVSEGRKRDSAKRETDIVITNQRGIEIHVEAKSLSGTTIYWPEREVSKAKELGERYHMVVLRPKGEKDFEQFWLRSPLEDLADMKRQGQWSWSEKDSPHSLDGDSGWTVPSTRPRKEIEATNFAFCILLSP